MSVTVDGISISTGLRAPEEDAEAAITHGIGALMAVVGGVYLVSEALRTGDPWCSLGCLLYSVSLFGVLASSTLSHLHLPEHLNQRFRAYDQGFIYLLAAGTLAPFAMTYLRTPAWLAFFGLSVLMAFIGFFSKVWFTHRVGNISLWFYLIVGWLQAIAMIPLSSILPGQALLWICAGAACYCLGLFFLMSDNSRFKFHTIWHLLVLAACGCHYLAILRFVVHGA